jgi:predicted nucleic acid-binding protein
VSLDVLAELDENVRAKAPHRMSDLATILDLSGVEVVEPPDIVTVQNCQRFLAYADDAVVLAAAITAQADYFVTLDRQHFLENPLVPADLPLIIGTPGDFLAWFRIKLSDNSWRAPDRTTLK